MRRPNMVFAALLSAVMLLSTAAAMETQTETEAVLRSNARYNLECSQFINFHLDLSDSMTREHRKTMVRELTAAVEKLAPAEGKLYYQLSTFASTASNAFKGVREYEPAAFLADVTDAVKLTRYGGYKGYTNHGAALMLGAKNLKAAQAEKPGLNAYTVMVVTDGVTSWWTHHPSKHDPKKYKKPKGAAKYPHLMHKTPCNLPECEINVATEAIKAVDNQRLAILFVGKKHNLPQSIALQKRSSMVGGEHLSDSLEDYNGFAGAVNRLVAGSCGGKIPPRDTTERTPSSGGDIPRKIKTGTDPDPDTETNKDGGNQDPRKIKTTTESHTDVPCENLYITIVSDISRSTVVGESPTANVKGVWDAVRSIYKSDKVRMRVTAFSSQWFDIVPKFVSPDEAAKQYADFELGMTQSSNSHGYHVTGAPESDFQTDYAKYHAAARHWTIRPESIEKVEPVAKDGAVAAAYVHTKDGQRLLAQKKGEHWDVKVPAQTVSKDRAVAYFRHNGKFQWLLDDTLPEPALAHAVRQRELGVPSGAKHVFVIHTDAGGYNNDNKKCHAAYGALAKFHDTLKTDDSVTDAKAHEKLMRSDAGRALEKSASTCCSVVDRRCDLTAALKDLKDPVVMLFAGTKFRSDTTIQSVIDANNANQFDGESMVFAGDLVADFPDMARAAMSQVSQLRQCYRKNAALDLEKTYKYEATAKF